MRSDPPNDQEETLIIRRRQAVDGAETPVRMADATVEPNTTPTSSTKVPSPAAPGLRYLALGDSYTTGESVTSSERFPAQLVRRLRARGVEIRNPQVVASTGWTTADLAAGMQEANLQDSFDLVTLLVGVNNQYGGLDIAVYHKELAGLIERAVELAGGDKGRVIVLSIPDWGVMPYARNFNRLLIAQQIDAYNKVNRLQAAQAGVRYVDVTALSRKAAEDASMVARDELHPSGKQYQAWVEILLPEVLSALG